MSDPADIVTQVGGPVGAAAAVAALMRWFAGKDASKAREEFVELRADVKQLLKDIQEHRTVFEDVVTTKNAVKTLGEKLDDLRAVEVTLAARITALEVRRPRR